MAFSREDTRVAKKQDAALNKMACAEILHSYHPDLRKIRLKALQRWINQRLIELCEGVEDDILAGTVHNFLNDARDKAGDLDPSGGLDGRQLQQLLESFVGPTGARIFVGELFALLKSGEESGLEGVPRELAVEKRDAEVDAMRIISRERECRDQQDERRYRRDGRGPRPRTACACVRCGRARPFPPPQRASTGSSWRWGR